MGEQIKNIFYWPGDWLQANTTQRQRLAVACWVSIFWLPPGPGFFMWLFWIHSLWFVGLMSVVALWMTGLTMVGAETPVEKEGDINIKN